MVPRFELGTETRRWQLFAPLPAGGACRVLLHSLAGRLYRYGGGGRRTLSPGAGAGTLAPGGTTHAVFATAGRHAQEPCRTERREETRQGADRDDLEPSGEDHAADVRRVASSGVCSRNTGGP